MFINTNSLLVLSGGPSSGKTNIVLAAALNILPVGIFSLELSKAEVMDRLIVLRSGVSHLNFKRGELSENEAHGAAHAMGYLGKKDIFIDDTPGISVAGIKETLKELKNICKPKLIVIDGLELIPPTRKMLSREKEIEETRKELDAIARELEIPILATSMARRDTYPVRLLQSGGTMG